MQLVKQIVKAFEASASPLAVVRQFLGSVDTKNMVATIAKNTGIEENRVEAVLTALASTIKQEIKDKKIDGQ